MKGLALTHTVLTLTGNTHGFTQSRPDLIGRNTIVKSSLSRVMTQVSQDQLTHQGSTLSVTELVENSEEKLAPGH